MAQTENICPADKEIYALRDLTGTIESIPLICGSILSKKIAEGINTLMLDVKYGNGAFMETIKDAKQLGNMLKKIGLWTTQEYRFKYFFKKIKINGAFLQSSLYINL